MPIRFSPEQDIAMLRECQAIDPFQGPHQKPYLVILENLIKHKVVTAKESDRTIRVLDAFDRVNTIKEKQSGIDERPLTERDYLLGLLSSSRREPKKNGSNESEKKENDAGKAIQSQAIMMMSLSRHVPKDTLTGNNSNDGDKDDQDHLEKEEKKKCKSDQPPEWYVEAKKAKQETDRELLDLKKMQMDLQKQEIQV